MRLRSVPLGLIAWSQVGYPLALALLAAMRGARPAFVLPDADDDLPDVTLVIAAHDEAAVIEARIANALALDYPRDRLQIVVSDDASTDGTPDLAQRAGADLVLRNARGGKVRAQDAALARATSEIVAFSDANAHWEPGALRALTAPFADPRVGYVCGQVRFVNPDGGTNQEGLYWRYEMFLRERESALCSVTGGNGAIYAVRRKAYVVVDPVMGHDLSFPFTLVRAGWRCRYEPRALATERMVPSIEGEGARKRRMMSHAWAIVLRGGLLDPRGWPPLYTAMIASHRWLRYAGPFLHLAGARRWHAALLAAAAGGARLGRPGLIARYYVLTQVSIALGLVDHLRHGTRAEWEAAEGTRT